MRVIHVVPAITEEASGPSYSVVRLCESLITEGEAVTLATLDWAPMDLPLAFLKPFLAGKSASSLRSTRFLLFFVFFIVNRQKPAVPKSAKPEKMQGQLSAFCA